MWLSGPPTPKTWPGCSAISSKRPESPSSPSNACDIITGVEVGTLQPDRIIDFVATSTPPDVDAVLVPDTAMATAAFLDDLEEAAGTVVLTANQVTMWDMLQIAGWEGAYPNGGTLFAGRR